MGTAGDFRMVFNNSPRINQHIGTNRGARLNNRSCHYLHAAVGADPNISGNNGAWMNQIDKAVTQVPIVLKQGASAAIRSGHAEAIHQPNLIRLVGLTKDVIISQPSQIFHKALRFTGNVAFDVVMEQPQAICNDGGVASASQNDNRSILHRNDRSLKAQFSRIADTSDLPVCQSVPNTAWRINRRRAA